MLPRGDTAVPGEELLTLELGEVARDAFAACVESANQQLVDL